MSQVFVNTAAWLALLNQSDRLHQQAKTVEKSLKVNRRLWVTTDFILIEVADAQSPCFSAFSNSQVDQESKKS